MDAMEMDTNSILCIHGGGVYNDKENTIRRWIEQFSEMPISVKQRIAIENCELNYNIEDCLYIADECKIPVIFDVHHFNCYNIKYDLEWDANDYIPYIIDSWSTRRMLAHISDQKDNSRLGAHHDYVERIPKYLMTIPEKYQVGCDIEIEAKAKEAAIFKLYKKYQDKLGTLIDFRVPQSMIDKYYYLIKN
jgi:UV DNA damage endonuclease